MTDSTAARSIVDIFSLISGNYLLWAARYLTVSPSWLRRSVCVEQLLTQDGYFCVRNYV